MTLVQAAVLHPQEFWDRFDKAFFVVIGQRHLAKLTAY
jgi:hypothetical protein